MNEFELHAGEQIIRENDNALWMKTPIYAKSGRLVLTDRRLVFVQSPTSLHAHGLGQLVVLLIKKLFPSLNGGVRYDIPLRSIMGMTKESYGMSETIVIVYGGQDKTRFAIGKGKYEEWQTAISMTKNGVKKAS